MSVTRKTVSFAQQIAIDRQYDEYVFGGNWDPFARVTGTDCSGCVVDELDAAISGTAMAWSRHGLSTEAWRPPAMGGSADPANGPFGTVMVSDPSQFPPDAAVLIALHHGDGGGANSHMWCKVDRLAIETHGSGNQFPNGATVLNDGVNFNDIVLDVHDTTYANSWWYLPGPIVEDGTPIPTAASPLSSTPATSNDTLFADVSEFQVPVDDTYPYRVLSIRVCDGTYVDKNFATNYAWMRKALDSGALTFGIVYTYVRPAAWQDNANTVQATIDANGGLHPRVALMLDVESGDGNGTANVSAAINALYSQLATYAGNSARGIGYGNIGDLGSMWPNKPAGLRVIVAAYGSNPPYPGEVAHQYTDGTGYGNGLPEGCAPFGHCDMNSADGLDAVAFAAACGITVDAVNTTPPPVDPPPVTPTPPAVDPTMPTFLSEYSDRQVLNLIAVQALGPEGNGWPQLGQNEQGEDLTPVDAIAAIEAEIGS